MAEEEKKDALAFLDDLDKKEGDNLAIPDEAAAEPEPSAQGAGTGEEPAEPAGVEAPPSIEIPDKFKKEDGSVNLEAMAKSYLEAEKELRRLQEEMAKKQQEPAQQPPQASQTAQMDEQMREMAEKTVEDLLSDPVKGLQRLAEAISPLVQQQVVPQVTQAMYQAMPPEERLKRVAVASAEQLDPATRQKLINDAERYEKSFDFLVQKLGPENVEAQMAGYAMAGKPPVQFIIDMTDTLDLKIAQQKQEIRQHEKEVAPAARGRGTSPQPAKTEPTIDELANAIINEDSTDLDF